MSLIISGSARLTGSLSVLHQVNPTGFLAISGTTALTSSDGITWTELSTGLPSGITWNDVAFSNGLYVAVGSLSTFQNGRIATSPDGINWTLIYSASTNLSLRGIASNGTGTWIASGYDLLSPSVQSAAARSTDNGVTWTEFGVGTGATAANQLGKVRYGNGRFVLPVVSSSSFYQLSMFYSDDGTSWTAVNRGAISRDSDVANDGNDNWVTASYGTGNPGTRQYKRSTDNGASWTSRTLSGSADAFAVAYGGGTFVIPNGSTSGQTSGNWGYSTDGGATWGTTSLPSSLNANYPWRSIAYGAGRFVCTSTNSTNFVHSPDGITWTAGTLTVSNAVLCYRSAI